MAKEATLQVRMDANVKEQAENLYRELGTSLAEAVRIFARQSIEDRGMPFVPKKSQEAVTEFARRLPEAGRIASDETYILPADWNDDEDDIYEKLI